MKTLTDFLRMTLVGGLLVVLPLWVSLLLLVKAIKSALVVLHPAAKLLPQMLVQPNVVAFCLLVLICFAVGLLIRARFGQRFEPALLEIEEALSRRSSLKSTPTDNSRCLFRPVQRRWRALSIFYSQNACIRWTYRCARRWFV